MPILIGDGMKEGKEAKKMPGVKKLHQESENSSKATCIFGHMFGAVGVLVGNASKMFCLPLSMRIHGGDKMLAKWADPKHVAESHVVRIVRDACRVAKGLLQRKSILLPGRYCLSVNALKALVEEQLQAGKPLVAIVVRVKMSAAAS